MDQGRAFVRYRRLAAFERESARSRPRPDPVLPAPCRARRFFPRRHASRQSVPDGRGAAGGGRFRHHGPSRPERAALPRRNPIRVHHPGLPAGGGGSFRGRLCAGALPRRRFRPGDPRRRRADPFAPRRRNLDGQAPDPAVRDHRLVRHADADRAGHAAKDHGGGRGRRPFARPPARHVVHRRAGGQKLDRGQSGPAGKSRRRGARPRGADPACDPDARHAGARRADGRETGIDRGTRDRPRNRGPSGKSAGPTPPAIAFRAMDWSWPASSLFTCSGVEDFSA